MQPPGSAPGLSFEHPVRGEDARRRAGLVVRGDVVVDGERVVGEVAGGDAVRGVDAGGGQRGRRGQVDVVLQQAAVGVAVLRDLGGVHLLGVGQPFDVLAVDRTPVP